MKDSTLPVRLAIGLLVAAFALGCEGTSDLQTESNNTESGAENNSATTPNGGTTPGMVGNGNDGCDIDAVIADNNCAACHSSTPDVTGFGLDLASDGLRTRLWDRPSNTIGCEDSVLVSSEDPRASLLLYSIAPDRFAEFHAESCQPARMPLGDAAHVSEEDVECVEAWIEALEPPTLDELDIPERGDAFTVLNRVKYLMHGGAVTLDELERVSDADGKIIDAELEVLVNEWLGTPEFHNKRRNFLELTLQQSPADHNYFYQFRNTNPSGLLGGLRSNLELSMVRTAERIIDDGEDFRTIATTNTWEVTTAVLIALKMADNPMMLNRFGIWPKDNGINDIKYLMSIDTLYDRDLDTQDWRTVTLIHDPASTEMMLESEMLDPLNMQMLRDIPDGGFTVLRAPRIGFFTTPSFFQTWLTNEDNAFRVTMNQTVIIATGKTFTPGDPTARNTGEEEIDPVLFPQGSECYACHKNLDPMVAAFKQSYDPVNTRHFEPTDDWREPVADFSFQGHSVPVNSLKEWAEALASHPNFATAWTLKLCQWANTTVCEPSNETVREIAAEFAASGHDMTTLFRSFFTSKLMTHTSFKEGTSVPGAQVSIARQQHYCQAMNVRLDGVLDSLGRSGSSLGDICTLNPTARVIGSSIPEDAFVRGGANLHQPKNYGLVTALSFDGLCSTSASELVTEDRRGIFRMGEGEEAAIDLMVAGVMGFPEGTPQFDSTRTLLLDIYATQTATPACSTPDELRQALQGNATCGMALAPVDALRNIWTMACQSPSLTGIGL